MRRLSLVLLLLVPLVACGGDDDVLAPLPKPAKVEGAERTATTAFEDLGAVALPRARGTTTTSVGLGPGRMRIDGTVKGPDGPVADAVVRLERLVGDAVATKDVPTDAEGRWNVERVLGGRWRIRAFRVPDLAQVGATVLFLAGDRPAPVALTVERFAGVSVRRSLAPDPPVVGAPLSLVVQVASRTVEADGTVRATPVVGTGLQLSGSGSSWSLQGPGSGTTDGNGNVEFRLVCRAEGEHALSVVDDTGRAEDLDLPACVLPTTTTTASTTPGGSPSSTPTTAAGSSSTTSTTSTTRPGTPTTVRPSTTTSTTRPR